MAAISALVFAEGAITVGQLGRFWVPLDCLNHLFPLWLALGLAGFAVLSFDPSRHWRGAGDVIAVVLLGFAGTVYLTGVAPVDDAHRGSPTLRLVQFNVFKGNATPEAAARWIVSQKAEVVVLEEAAEEGGRLRVLLAPSYPHAIDCVGQQTSCSTVIMTVLTPAEAGGLARGDPENQGGLSAAWMRLAGPPRPATIIGVHLGRPWPFADQAPQVRELSSFLKTVDRDHTIVVGDFNQTPWTFAMARQDRAIDLRRLTGDRASWPLRDIAATFGALHVRTPPILSIDHVYVGRCWTRSSIRSGPWLGSDHAPLIIELKQLC